jgi:hypothetical protein
MVEDQSRFDINEMNNAIASSSDHHHSNVSILIESKLDRIISLLEKQESSYSDCQYSPAWAKEVRAYRIRLLYKPSLLIELSRHSASASN